MGIGLGGGCQRRLGRIRVGVVVAAREYPAWSCGRTNWLEVSTVGVKLFGITARAQMRVQEKHTFEGFERARAHDWI